VPERGGTPFRQIFLSRNGAPVNIVYHNRNADTAAFRQIISYYKKITLYTKFGQLVRRKIIEIVATRCHILRLKWTRDRFLKITLGTPSSSAEGAMIEVWVWGGVLPLIRKFFRVWILNGRILVQTVLFVQFT